MSILTERDIRDEVRDRSPGDHTLHVDVLFTSEDIASAMRWAARRYNSMQPQVECVDAARLPGDTNIFLDGVVAALFRRLCNNESLNELSYAAGSVTIDGATLKKNLEKLSDKYEKSFDQAALERKLSINIRAAFGKIG